VPVADGTQVFLDIAAYMADLGYLLQGGYPQKAVFIEQFVKPTAEEVILQTPVEKLEGKPVTIPLGSDTMVCLQASVHMCIILKRNRTRISWPYVDKLQGKPLSIILMRGSMRLSCPYADTLQEKASHPLAGSDTMECSWPSWE
jgi:hypothetical protein